MSVLCATDLLSRSNAVVDRAGYLAERLRADLALLHVVPPTLPEQARSRELQAASHELKLRAQASSWARNAQPNVIVRTGKPADAILETARETKATMVVLGAHRRRSGAAAMKETIVERVLASHAVPTLIVRRKPRGAYRDVVLALDATAASGSAVRGLEALGIAVDAPRCTVLHAYEPPYEGMMHYAGANPPSVERYIAAWRRECRGAIVDALSAESRAPWRYDITLAEGKAGTAIQKYVERHDPDLLVMGTRGGGRLHRALLGSVAHEVLGRVRCDVLVVPQNLSASIGAQARDYDRKVSKEVRHASVPDR